MAEIPAGWYPDPSGDISKLRYWNGAQWTENYAPATQEGTVASASSESPEQQAYQQPTYQQPPAYQQPTYQSQPAYTTPSYTNSTDQTLRLIAFILNIVTCIGWAAAIIPLIWMIPMTIHSWGIYKGTKPNTVAFGVCTLIFLNLISGILYLVSTKDQ